MEFFRIAIEETVINEFFVEANDKNEAIDTAIQKYDDGELVLDPDHFKSRQMAVVNNTSPTEWFEF